MRSTVSLAESETAEPGPLGAKSAGSVSNPHLVGGTVDKYLYVAPSQR